MIVIVKNLNGVAIEFFIFPIVVSFDNETKHRILYHHFNSPLLTISKLFSLISINCNNIKIHVTELLITSN